MKWGDWALDPTDSILKHVPTGYNVHVSDIDTSAAMLDWIFQVQGKPWADAKCMHGLLCALDAILGPQGNYCSMEQNLSADGEQLVRDFLNRNGYRTG